MDSTLHLYSNWSVSCRSDIVVVGSPAELQHVEAYYVFIERKDGRRLAHNHRFVTSDLGKREAIKRVEELMGRILQERVIDLGYWSEIDPSYGSDYYIDQEHYF